MSWRDETPQEVQDDLDQLADESLSAATHFLEKNGELYPFGFRLPLEGDPEMVPADPGHGEQPLSQAVLDLLYEGVAASRRRPGARPAPPLPPQRAPPLDRVRRPRRDARRAPPVAPLALHEVLRERGGDGTPALEDSPHAPRTAGAGP